jgi:hypothetical protein
VPGTVGDGVWFKCRIARTEAKRVCNAAVRIDTPVNERLVYRSREPNILLDAPDDGISSNVTAMPTRDVGGT